MYDHLVVVWLIVAATCEQLKARRTSTVDKLASSSGVSTTTSLGYRTLPLYGPCTFPTPHSGDARETRENARVCRVRRQLSFLCDLHSQLQTQSLYPLLRIYDAHRHLFEPTSRANLQIVVVHYLPSPSSLHVHEIDDQNEDFGCLFRTPSLTVTAELLDKLAHNNKVYTKVYTAALFKRWFPNAVECLRPPILALVVTEGLLNDARKLASVNLHSERPELVPLLANIQMEAANALLQGVPLVETLTDLINQLGYSLRNFNASLTRRPNGSGGGGIGELRARHRIPIWAIELAAISVMLVVLALCAEWYVVRRSVATKRSSSGQQVDAVRSKTHLIF